MINKGLLYLFGFFLVGIFEEYSFRGYTQYTLASGMSFWPAAVVLSLLFGATHLFNPGEGVVGAASVVMIAMFFCLTLRRTGALWFAIGLHCSFDWGETFLFSVPNSGNLAEGCAFALHDAGRRAGSPAAASGPKAAYSASLLSL